ncbi:MAG TPA: hypothetical protein V6C90_01730 [Coleofasciculaceae cyanobacterium]
MLVIRSLLGGPAWLTRFGSEVRARLIMGNAIADFKSQPASAANNIIDASFSRQMKFVPF